MFYVNALRWNAHIYVIGQVLAVTVDNESSVRLYAFHRSERKCGRHSLTLSAREVRRQLVWKTIRNGIFATTATAVMCENERAHHDYVTDVHIAISECDITLRYATLANLRLRVRNRSMESNRRAVNEMRGNVERCMRGDDRLLQPWDLLIPAHTLSRIPMKIYSFTSLYHCTISYFRALLASRKTLHFPKGVDIFLALRSA